MDINLENLAYHAAGDIVVSYLLGFKIIDAQIDYNPRDGQDYSALTEGPDDPYTNGISYPAGYLSEQIHTNSFEELDLGELSEDADLPITDEMVHKCRELLTNNWQAVEVLAAVLLDEKLISGERAMDIINNALSSQ